MTKEDIIRMAREAGVYLAHTELTLMTGLERFANLVAAHEREECAKVCEDDRTQAMEWLGSSRPGGHFAAAIRADLKLSGIRLKGDAMKHGKTFAAIEKLKDIEIELHRLKNALELANKMLDAKKPWVGMTDEELIELSESGLHLWELWKAIEAKLKEKNV
jgi:hypothetical protein